jgi:hypothetical protein
MIMKNKALSLLLSVCSLLALYSFQNLKETIVPSQANVAYDQTFDNVKKIELEMLVGSVKLVPSKSKQVRVKGYYDENDYQVKVEQSGNKLTIFEKNKRNNTSSSSEWELEVPEGIELNSNQVSGGLSVQGIAAEIDGQSASGSLLLEDYKGEISWNTGSGRLEVANSSGRITFNTGSGNVETTTFTGKGQFNTGSGNIMISRSSGGFSANTGSGDVEAEDLEIIENSSFNTGSGDSSVKLGKVTKGNISVASGSGDASVDFNANAFKGVLTMKCSKRNGSIKAPFAFDKETEEEPQGRGNDTKLVKIKRFGNSGVDIKVLTGSGKATVRE